MAIIETKNRIMSSAFDPTAPATDLFATFDMSAAAEREPASAPEASTLPDAVFVETTSSSNFLAELEPGQTILTWAQEVKDAGGYFDEEENRFYPWHAITSIVFRASEHYTKGK